MSYVRDNIDLLAAYRRGERRALAQIYDHYAPELVNLIRRGFTSGSQTATRVPGLLDPQKQCDLLQETFLRAFSEKARQGYRAVSPFRTYLFAIAKNLMVDNLRRYESRHVDIRDVGDIDLILERNGPFEPEEPVDALHWRRQREVAKQFMGSLPEEQRRFCELRFEDGRTQMDVAAEMSISRRRVRTLEARILQSLRKQLRSKGLWP